MTNFINQTPMQRPFLGGLARLAKGLSNYASDPSNIVAKAFPASDDTGVKLTSGLANLLGVSEAGSVLEKLAYGEALTKGRNQTLSLKPAVLEGITALAPLATGLAAGASKVAGKLPLPRKDQLNAITWHGSPHNFDKFDSSKIGTGEGAQSYGHGLYLAENPSVAQSYKIALAPGRGNSDADTLVRLLDAVDNNVVKAVAELDRRAKFASTQEGKTRFLTLAEKLRSGYDPRGALYKVDLPDEQAAQMLNWDAPLLQQAPEVLNRLNRSKNESVLQLLDTRDRPGIYSQELPDGSDIMRGLAFNLDSRQNGPKSAQHLSKLGIPGVRYLDQASRKTGTGTSNFVVFPGNESMLQILERNGKPLQTGFAGR